MRILFVAPYLPSPPRFGGQRRLDGLVRGLAARHEVSILAFNKIDPYTELSLEATKQYCALVETIPELDSETDGRGKRLLQARSIFSSMSYERLVVERRTDFQNRLRRVVNTGNYDVIQIEFAQMGAYDFTHEGAKAPILVLDEHNIEYDLQRRSAEADKSVARWAYNALNWRKLRQEERRSWSTCNGVVVTSPRDQALLVNGRKHMKSAVVPNGVDVDAFRPSSTPPDPKRILFFGAINYFPNQDGLVHFLDNTFPLVVEKQPDTKLWIVGPGARKPVLNRQRGNIEITGFVDDVNPYLDAASVVVVPLRIGGGTRLKIVEAMAKGKAVVSTSIGAEGLDIVDGTHAIIADTPEKFATEVADLLARPERAREIGVAARKLAEERYSWTAVVRELEQFYVQLASEIHR